MRNSSENNSENLSTEKDVLGLPKQSNTNTESFTTLDKVLNWKLLLLIFLFGLGLFLIYQKSKKVDPLKVAPTDNSIGAGTQFEPAKNQ